MEEHLREWNKGNRRSRRNQQEQKGNRDLELIQVKMKHYTCSTAGLSSVLRNISYLCRNKDQKHEMDPPAGYGRPGEGYAHGSALVLHFLGSSDFSGS